LTVRVIVTRVQPQARQWVQMLQATHQAVALPLMETTGLADTTALLSAWQHRGDYHALMFVSSHAVNYFFLSKQALAQSDNRFDASNTRAWATGPGTRTALLAQGLAAALVDSPPIDAGQYDSEALWQQVKHQVGPGVRVLIVRGDTQDLSEASADVKAGPRGSVGVGRDWLAERLQSAGAQVDFVVAYQRVAPVWTPPQLATAQAGATDGSIWLFSSAEALTHLRTLLPSQAWSAARAVATHGRIAEAARQLGFGVVSESRPTLASVLASIESMA